MVCIFIKSIFFIPSRVFFFIFFYLKYIISYLEDEYLIIKFSCTFTRLLDFFMIFCFVLLPSG